jgi:hypothetical protein
VVDLPAHPVRVVLEEGEPRQLKKRKFEVDVRLISRKFMESIDGL